MPTLTIFTPTYNRAYSLHLCYESLCRQTSKDFCWLVIDDGSTDNTRELVEGWAKAIIKQYAIHRDRSVYASQVAAAGYDVEQNALWLQNYYLL